MELDGPGFIECNVAGLEISRRPLFVFPGEPLSGRTNWRATWPKASQRTTRRSRLALDLFAGVGLFALPLAKSFAARRGRRIESRGGARSRIERAADAARVEVRADGRRALPREIQREARSSWSSIRRAPGLNPTQSRHLARIAPARITYVSCDPPTLARDLAALIQSRLRNFGHSSLRSFPANISHGDGGSSSPPRVSGMRLSP